MPPFSSCESENRASSLSAVAPDMRCSIRSKSSAIFVIALWVFTSAVKLSASSDPCALPKDLQALIEREYAGSKIVTLTDLNEDDRKLFQKEHADACPGLARVDFYGDGKPTVALALTAGSEANRKTKLVLAHNNGEAWKTMTLDKADGRAPVVWSDKPGESKGVYQHKIRATRPVIVFCGYSSWAILYAWMNNKIAKIWLRD